ncbi:uncharacterized protein V1518DRAFT_417800 [Limtongia smithiae]|uniref:uncharacterized protein n=1 Tax=Limtongia smithiae TaxID=1125753 RepID=UPI0034CEFD16
MATPWLSSRAALYSAVFDSAIRAPAIVSDAAAVFADDWQLTTAWMQPQAQLRPPTSSVNTAISRLHAADADERLLFWYVDATRAHFVAHALPAVGRIPTAVEGGQTIALASSVRQVLSTLSDARKHYLYPVGYVWPGRSAQQERILGSLNAMIDIALKDSQFGALTQGLIVELLDLSCREDSDMAVLTEVRAIMMDIMQLAIALKVQGLVRYTMIHVYNDFIDKFVHERYEKRFELSEDEPTPLTELCAIIAGPVAQSVEIMAGRESMQSGLIDRMIDRAGEAFLKMRTEEMFDIVVNYPESMSALEDAKACMKTQEDRVFLVTTFMNSISKRLLHCGANTWDIISFYISTIKVLRYIDPRGVLLDKVSRPIRRYLRERDDWVKCVVSGILEVDDPNMSDLSELGKELAAYTGEGDAQVNEGDLSDMNWVPDPIDAAPDFRNKRNTDLIGAFLSLYDNKEVFVKEIVSVLASRLLDLHDYDIDKEMMQLELLKLKFGEQELHNCDVMVRDISDSKRVDVNVHQPVDGAKEVVSSVLHGRMLSQLFWPPLRDRDDLALPADIESELVRYSARYAKLKSGRTLKWMKRLGAVDVTLELEDRTLDMTVTPERASMIYLFQETSLHTVDELAAALKLDGLGVRRVAGFWVKEGVLKAVGEASYEVLERAETAATKRVGLLAEEEESGAVLGGEAQAKEEMRVYWSYILGMLTNLQALPLAKMQSFLKMLIPREVGYSSSEEELRGFLEVMIAEEKLELVGGVYRLRK